MQPAYWIMVLIIGILLIEIAQGRHKGVHRRHDFYIIGAALVGGQLTRPLLALVTAWAIGAVIPAYQGALAGAPFLPSLLVLLLVAEFCQYWIHRAAHNTRRFPWLYGMHRTHHSAPYVNVTLMYRTNLIWPFVHSYTWVAAIGFYLGLFAPATAFYILIMAWNALTHSDWRWDDAIAAKLPGGTKIVPALELVLVTPRIHHTHHGYGRDGKVYRNFCTFFSFYDRLFGTLHIPEGRPWRYGLPGGEHDWWRQMIYPVVPLGKAKKHAAKSELPHIRASRSA
jgi:sterol desaturase/sphingolipid hydroxylase (fatty acid hydroxylase superfamily)